MLSSPTPLFLSRNLPFNRARAHVYHLDCWMLTQKQVLRRPRPRLPPPGGAPRRRKSIEKKKKTDRPLLSFFPQSASFCSLLFNGARHCVLALLQILLSPSDSLTWKKPSGTGSLWDKRRTSTCLLAAAHPRAPQHLSSLSLRNPIKYVVHKMINTDFISPHVIIGRSTRLIELALLVLVRV